MAAFRGVPTQIVDYKRAAIEMSETQEAYRLRLMSAMQRRTFPGYVVDNLNY